MDNNINCRCQANEVYAIQVYVSTKTQNEIPVFLILDMHARNKKSWITSLYLA